MKREAEEHWNKSLKNLLDRRNRFYMGDQWYDVELEHWQAAPVINKCRQIVDWYWSLLTDSQAKLAVLGYSPDDYLVDENTGLSPVDRVTKLMRQKWDDLHIENLRGIALHHALWSGVGWLKVYIDPYKERTILHPNAQGMDERMQLPGDVAVAALGPSDVYIDPTASWTANPIEVTKTAEYMGQKHMVSVRALKRHYPHLAERIDALPTIDRKDFAPWKFRNVDPVSGVQQEEWLPEANAAGSTANKSGQWVKVPPQQEMWYSGKRVCVTEHYMRDASAPTGKVCLTMVDDFLLEARGTSVQGDKPYPFEHNHFPFTLLVANAIPGRTYGFGVLDNLMSIQQIINKSAGQILDYVNFFKGPPFVYEEGSIDMTNFAMAPSCKVKFRGERPPFWLHTPTPPAELFRTKQENIEILHDLAGINESIMAGNIKAGTAGVAVEGMIDQAMQRIRKVDRENLASNAEFGYQLLGVTQQVVKGTKYELRQLGPHGHPQSLFLQPDDMMGRKDFRITTDSARSLKMEALFKKLMDLSSAPPAEQRGVAIPDDELIDAADVPQPDKLKEEVAATKSLQMMIQQLQQENEMLQQQLQQAGAPPPEQPPVGGMM
jgi:hypothetical protein